MLDSMRRRFRQLSRTLALPVLVACAIVSTSIAPPAEAGTYTNFESSQVHPIALTPDQTRLLVVNTPDAVLEIFDVGPSGELTLAASVPVGLEPVSVVARSDQEAWVVNHLSDTISIVDLTVPEVGSTLDTGDEPTDVVFAAGKAFVAVSQEDAVDVYNLADLSVAPTRIDLFGVDTRALTVNPAGTRVYAVVQNSGNQTTVIGANVIENITNILRSDMLAALGVNTINCDGNANPYPPLPAGITRNPALTDPPDGEPRIGLIVKWNDALGRWEDDAGQDWSHCLPVRLPDQDVFVIDTATSAVIDEYEHVGTTLFEVSFQPTTDHIWVPNTDARNFVRFEHPLGLQGHIVENQLTRIDTTDGSLEVIDLNGHINRASDPATNLAEREASISQPRMMVWEADGSHAWLTAIGSRKVFRVDGSCTTANCIVGGNRATPASVEVGGGPSGVALLESQNRLYVLNRFDNAVAIVDTTSLTKVDEVALHDPSSDTIKDGRHLLYDGVISSAHGDAACSSCHISGDMDGLAWDLGNPAGDLALYSDPTDNVRFVEDSINGMVPCEPGIDDRCASKTGFDPQKGPMTVQTLRGMLEPLHWRADRATFASFNPAFIDLLGVEDIGPVNGKPAGLSGPDMELFRQFSLGITLPPNPYRNVDDTLPDEMVSFPTFGITGNPTAGQNLFENVAIRGPRTCGHCHNTPFGTVGGKLGGVDPTDPVSLDATALTTGKDAHFDSNAFDLEIPHFRNLYEKRGPVYGDHQAAPPLSKSGFGFTHDGSIPDLDTLLSTKKMPGFDPASPQEVRDVSAFLLSFASSTKPSVGRSLTVPAGTPPTGTTAEEDLLQTLISLGDLADEYTYGGPTVYGGGEPSTEKMGLGQATHGC